MQGREVNARWSAVFQRKSPAVITSLAVPSFAEEDPLRPREIRLGSHLAACTKQRPDPARRPGTSLSDCLIQTDPLPAADARETKKAPGVPGLKNGEKPSRGTLDRPIISQGTNQARRGSRKRPVPPGDARRAGACHQHRFAG